MKRFEGKAAVVLGASAGGDSGRAIAGRLAREGARVAVHGKRWVGLDEVNPPEQVGGFIPIRNWSAPCIGRKAAASRR
jgi:NAD(P)-dependent dehydrogenase (short-subunit alcohol dehydrogenase family)